MLGVHWEARRAAGYSLGARLLRVFECLAAARSVAWKERVAQMQIKAIVREWRLQTEMGQRNSCENAT